MQTEVDKKWYYSTWFIILTLLFFFPVGLVLMWMGRKFNLYIRIGVTFLLAIFVMVNIFTAHQKATTAPSTQSTQVQQKNEEAKKPQINKPEERVEDKPNAANKQSPSSSSIIVKNKPGDIINGFKIENIAIEKAGYTGLFGSKIVVTMTNTTGKNCSSVDLDVKGWDKDNIQVLSTSWVVGQVDAGATFRKEIIIEKNTEVKTFELLKVSVYR